MRIQFDFSPAGNNWNMGPACGDPSQNPAPVTFPILYLIHNFNTNTTYAGYAQDAQHRWGDRTEVFHCLGIAQAYAQNVFCAMCIPHILNGHMRLDVPGAMHGAINTAEHLLIRAVVNGLLGITTCMNTVLRNVPYTNPHNYTDVDIYLPADPWGTLHSDRTSPLPFHAPY